ncbi:MAG TPA: LysR family transcriptional regulator [Eoetvoesiella sp.]
MSIRSLKTFIAVARHGSFAAAANDIGLTQAAVSIQMKALEEDLRVQLFDRSARKVVLNTAGRALVQRAQELVRLYENMASNLDGQQLGGLLALGAIPPTFSELLPEALLVLRQDHPGIAVHVSTGISSELTRKVEQGELDAAIVGQPPHRLDHHISWHPIVAEPLLLLTPASSKEDGLAATLASHPFISITRSSWTGQLIHALLRRHRLQINETMELDSLEIITSMVARGFGVSILPLMPSRWALDERVRVALLTDPPVTREIGLIHRNVHDREQLVAALRKSLLAVPKEPAVDIRKIAIRS